MNSIKQDIPPGIRLAAMVTHYEKSKGYTNLQEETQKAYSRHLRKVCSTEALPNIELGKMRLKDISTKHLTDSYEQWFDVGKRTANIRCACLSVVFEYAIQQEVIRDSPLRSLKRKQDSVRKVKWNKDQVRQFLTVAYSDFNWRSIGLIIHMSYDLAQRVGDMRSLKWESINLDLQRLDITQSKRGAEVHLPISDSLIKMLRKQQEDFGFQEYVSPRVKPIAQSYSPYRMKEISYLVNEVKAKAKLPKELTAMDLRRTAITEMVEAGVDLAGIMQVSGHKDPQSVKPYLVNTYSGASTALNKRFEHEQIYCK